MRPAKVSNWRWSSLEKHGVPSSLMFSAVEPMALPSLLMHWITPMHGCTTVEVAAVAFSASASSSAAEDSSPPPSRMGTTSMVRVR